MLAKEITTALRQGKHTFISDIISHRDMVSRIKFKRCVGVQSETIELNISERKLVPDFEMPISEHRSFKYFFRRCKRADCRIECKKTAMRIC